MNQSIHVLCLSQVLPPYQQALVDHDLVFFNCNTLDDFKTILQDGAIDIILSDFSFPGSGPAEMEAHLFQENLDLPVIAVLEEISEEKIVQLMMEGAADCVPTDQPARLKAIIHREVKNLRLRKDLEKRRLENVRSVSGRLAHDFNNILAPITMSAPMLKWEIEDEEYDDIVDTLEKSVHNGAAMIHDLMIFARGIQLERSQVDLKILLEETLTAFRKSVPENIRVEFQTGDDPISLSADPEKLKQACLYLLENASEAMPEGGMIEVRLGKEYGGDNLQISISDQGTGMDAATLEQIFDPFFSTKRHAKKGAGLGLSLALGIIKSHKGSITASSRPGKGSRFRINLPVKTA